ncbi:signal peptidase II [Paraburkholderia acidicola]|uniref:Lipoprotein signal peptidase n=1 Tax=Paraburkholderia acidicola TaxID=1912599 RepID=A0A2A4F4M1_9BURK|nr:signal peptidase II [Paraburkholderia acidicola]PCE28075.1 signal peptidase II [Paraburkholderia acidicola]
MARTLSKSSGGTLAPWLGVALIVILFDQLSKIAVSKVFAYAQPYELTPFFNLFLVFNRGAAFSFLATAGGWQRWGFTALGVVAALVICYLLKRHGAQRLFCTALALILGGALGNVIDRLMYGHVIDFLDFHVRAWHWPAFNLADSAITIGAALLVFDELRRVRGSR